MSVLACLLHLLSVALVAMAQSSSGTGEQDDTCTQCDTPTDAPQLANLTTNFTEAVLEARCLAMCLHLQVQNDSTLIRDGEQYWYLLQSDIEANCTLYHQVYSCSRGCVSASRVNNNETESNDNCMSLCASDVNFHDQGICTGSYVEESQCSQGCSAYKTMKNGEKSFLKPDNPLFPLVMDKDDSLETVGTYVVKVADGVLSEGLLLGSNPGSGLSSPDTELGMEQFFVTFIFRVVDQQQADEVYIVKAGLPKTISLDFFSCEYVTVSYALVNLYGASKFSYSTAQEVEGVELGQPEAAQNLSYTWQYDSRVGFFGHLCLNLSWVNPMSLNSVTRFEIMYGAGEQNQNKCGSAEEVTVKPVPGLFGHTMLCATNKTSPFIAKCSYVLEMLALPVLDCAENRSSDILWLSTNPEQLPDKVANQISDLQQLNPHCDRRLNHADNKFVMDLTIELSDYLFQEHVITGFALLLIRDELLPDGNMDTDTLISPFLKMMPKDNSTFRFSFYQLEPTQKSTVNYTVVVSAEWEAIYEPNVESFFCSISALSERPDVIKNVTLDRLIIMKDDYTYTVKASWVRPQSFNGAFDRYEIVITDEILAPNVEDPPGSANHLFVTEVNQTHVMETFPYHPTVFCYYLYVRSFNKYLASNWSEPVVLVVDSRCLGDLPVSSISSLVTTPSSFMSTPSFVATSSPVITSPPVTMPTSHLATPTEPQSLASSTVYLSVIGVVIAILSMACVITLLCGHWIMRRRKRRLELVQEDFDPMFRSGPRHPSVHAMNNIFPLTDEWEIPPAQIIIDECLGQGAFGEVYKGLIIEPVENLRMKNMLKQCGSNTVAVKLLKTSAAGPERSDFLKEIDMMKKIAEGNNPHVVNMIGCVTLQEPLCLVTEFVKHGDLLSYLRTTRKQQAAGKRLSGAEDDSQAAAYFEDPYPELSELMPVDLISFAYQIASGMEFLSSLGIVHRDLACRNILVGEGKSLKISDFGMSREVGTGADDAYIKTTKGRLPLKWMAIESIVDREFTAASDVWSFGVLLWEIGTLGGFPYPTLQNEDLLMFLRRGHRMEKPENCSAEIYEIMLDCWHDCPQKRPTFTQLRAKFDSLLAAQHCNVYIDLQTDEQQDIYKTELANEEDGRLSSSSSSSSAFERSPILSRRDVASGKSLESCHLTVTNAWDQHSCNEVDGPTLSPTLRATRRSSPRMSPGASPRLSPNPSSETHTHRPLSLVLWDTEARKENPYVDDPFERMNAAGIVIQVSSSSPSSPTATPRAAQISVGVRNPLFK